MVLPVSPTLQIVLSHNKLGKGGHATLFRFWGEVVWSKAIQMAQILRFFSFILVRRKTVFSFQYTENHVLCFTLLVFMEHFLPTFCTLCEENESLAVRPYSDPPVGQGWISAHVEREDLNSKEVTGQTDNVLARDCREIQCTDCPIILEVNVSFPKC